MKETMKQAGYNFVRYMEKGQALFYNQHTRKLELWAANKNHASSGIHYNNTDWEFVREWTQ